VVQEPEIPVKQDCHHTDELFVGRKVDLQSPRPVWGCGWN
jgi:hypothetical protein